MANIVIKVWQGLVTEVFSDDKETNVIVVDMDTDEEDAVELPRYQVY